MAASDLTSHVSVRQKSKPYAGGKSEICHRGDPGLGPAWAGKASNTEAPGRQRDAVRRRPPREKNLTTITALGYSKGVGVARGASGARSSRLRQSPYVIKCRCVHGPARKSSDSACTRRIILKKVVI